MRTHITFILKIWVDPQDSESMHGTIQAVQEDQSHSFTSRENLLALLQGLMHHAPEEPEARSALMQDE